MKKYVSLVAGFLLGAAFLVAIILSMVMKFEPPKEGTPAAHFMSAVGPTGYMTFVKTFEITGALIVMIPRLRNLGLLILGPVIVNIFAFHIFVEDPMHLVNPIIIIITVCALYLVWDARHKFSALVN